MKILFIFLTLVWVSVCNADKSAEAQSLASDASMLVSKGKYSEAIPLLKEASALNPGCAEYHVGLAMASVMVKDYETARAGYLAAKVILKEESQNDPERVDDLILVLFCLNENQEAKDTLNSSIQRFPDHALILTLSESYPAFFQGFEKYRLKQ